MKFEIRIFAGLAFFIESEMKIGNTVSNPPSLSRSTLAGKGWGRLDKEYSKSVFLFRG